MLQVESGKDIYFLYIVTIPVVLAIQCKVYHHSIDIKCIKRFEDIVYFLFIKKHFKP